MSQKAALRKRRGDGDKTRERIIEAAGELFAQHGYHGTTSKAICHRSHVNQAAVNYHFGSRKGLYEAILSEVHESLIKMDDMESLLHNTQLNAEQKLQAFIRQLIPAIMDAKSWQLRIWAREIAAPSECFPELMAGNILPKFDYLRQLISQVTGLDVDSPKLLPAIYGFISPCLMLLISNREPQMPMSGIFSYSPAHLSQYLQQFLLAGLKGLSAD
ncbi:TetR/AcrR family transcriptional regulator [Celerinatantimonas sp. YJH-8]|uniref:TetR/AcrR family transcriptional regulator n=1 Tax=Celerinatantimonas sp. YJH-8 TaxID=3228714 RepID=UPI0038CBDEBB